MRFWKSAVFYSLIAIMLLVSVGMDYVQKKEMEEDLKNTSGPPPAIGSQAPEFNVMNKDKAVISSNELYEKNTLIVFWDINCSPSIEMLRKLDNYIKTQDTGNINIIPINTENTSMQIEKFFSGEQIDLPIFTDNKKSAKWAFKVTVHPSIYIIDDQGLILHRQTGFSDVIMESIINILNAADN